MCWVGACVVIVPAKGRSVACSGVLARCQCFWLEHSRDQITTQSPPVQILPFTVERTSAMAGVLRIT